MTEQHPGAIGRFARDYGWWRVFAIPVLAIITVWVLVDVARSSGSDDAGHEHGPVAAAPGFNATGPDPAQTTAVVDAVRDQLPAGGAFAESGDGTYRDAGGAGKEVGKGEAKTIRYSVEIENGIDTTTYGGDGAFSAMVDATLADPRGWTNDPGFKFVHVAADDSPDTRIRLTSLRTTAELCGAQLETETSCHTGITGESTVILNEARWVRGAVPYEGDLGNYRQYLINHEFGHAIGYAAHQPCGKNGALAPVMMQQTLSLNNSELHEAEPEEVYPDDGKTCEPNPWPYPQPSNLDPHSPEA